MSDDELLVNKAQRGDKDAAEELLRRYKHMVLKCTRPYYIVGAEQDDLIQEGMLGLYRAVLTYNIGKSKFITYAYQCVKSAIYDAVKAASTKKHQWLRSYVDNGDNETVDAVASPELIAEQIESSEALMDKIKAALSKREYIVFSLYIAGNSISDIAELTNVTYKSVENALQRIRSKIRNNVIL